MDAVSAARAKIDANHLEESKALQQPRTLAPAKMEPVRPGPSYLTPQEFRYAMIHIGDRRMLNDEEI